MTLLSRIASFLRDPRLEGVDIDSPNLMDIHRRILSEKPMMRGVFEEFYTQCVTLADKHFPADGDQVELGAGVSLFKQFYPDVISTDIKPSPALDRVLDAQNMELPSASVRAFYGLNCFHHLPEPERFFAEIIRTCPPGGGTVLIEPYHSWLGRILYRAMHRQEHFNMRQNTWETPLEPGQFMSGANQALSYIVFVRDRERFERSFPQLELVAIKPLSNWVRYLLSGGLNFRALVPDFFIPAIKVCETLLKPFHRLFALHYIIVLRHRQP